MKKIYIIALIIFPLIVIGAYIYVRYSVLRSEDFKPDNSKAKNLLDLRPAIISKLQQLVKDGSNGLYVLSIEKIDPDVIASRLHVLNASISVDTVVMQRLDQLKKLPEDIFSIKFASMLIDGMGMNDLLHSEKMDIKSVLIEAPIIHVYRKTRAYNLDEEKKEDTTTLYQRLTKQMKSLAIGEVHINQGTLIVHNQNRKNDQPDRFNDVSIVMKEMLLDSSTQFDEDRFLFARKVTLHTLNYSFNTPDNLYTVRLGDVTLSGEDHRMTILNAELKPKYNRTEFEKRLRQRDEMYNIVLPKITLNDVNWWQLMNREKIVSRKADIMGGSVSIFVNKALPLGEPIPPDRFPHQLLMMIPLPVMLSELRLHDLDVHSSLYIPTAKTTVRTDFSHINGTVTNVTNIPSAIKQNAVMYVIGSGLFMGQVPLQIKLRFDLGQYKSGDFIAEISMDTLNKETINPIAGPTGQFTVKRGQMQKGMTRLTGDNKNIHGSIAFYYDDLHITPLKIDSISGNQKKAHLKSFFANILFIKNENPDEGGPLRKPEFDIIRGPHEGFVAYIWMAIMTGICKTIGIPVRVVMKER